MNYPIIETHYGIVEEKPREVKKDTIAKCPNCGKKHSGGEKCKKCGFSLKGFVVLALGIAVVIITIICL